MKRRKKSTIEDWIGEYLSCLGEGLTYDEMVDRLGHANKKALLSRLYTINRLLRERGKEPLTAPMRKRTTINWDRIDEMIRNSQGGK